MKHASSGRRSRNRNNNNGNGNRRGNNKTKVFDSNGPDVRIRGTAHQVFEKYTALSKDASSAGDVILAESYLQYAEHYQRLISGWNESLAEFERTGVFPEDQSLSDRQEVRQNSKHEKSSRPAKGSKSEDLGLPSSIIGDEVNVKPEKTLEQA